MQARSLVTQKITSTSSENRLHLERSLPPWSGKCLKLLKDSIPVEVKEEALMRPVSEGLQWFAEVVVSVSSFPDLS